MTQELRICKFCKTEFGANRKDKRFCSNSCNARFNAKKNYEKNKENISLQRRLRKITETRICEQCKKEFVANRIDKIFCSKKCNARFNSKRNYEQNKSNPAYINLRKKYFQEWYGKNKEKNKEYYKNYYIKNRDIIIKRVELWKINNPEKYKQKTKRQHEKEKIQKAQLKAQHNTTS